MHTTYMQWLATTEGKDLGIAIAIDVVLSPEIIIIANACKTQSILKHVQLDSIPGASVSE